MAELPVLSPAGISLIVMLVGAFVAVFWRWFWKQHQHSLSAPSDWGHAYVIPVISGYLIWRQRAELARTAARTFWPGLAALAFGLGAYFFCVVGIKNHMLQGFAMIVALFGLVLMLCGPAVMRLVFLPIAYLGFGVTISEQIMIKITFQLQLIASEGGGALLQLIGPVMGFRADVEGNVLTLVPKIGGASVPLNVAEACSGMRMVIAFVALGAAVALVACREWWQRIALILLATPVAVLMNVVRVAVLAVLAVKVDPALAGGKAHEMIGTLLLLPGLLMYLGMVWALNRVIDEPPATAKRRVLVPTMDWPALRRPAYSAAAAVLVLSAGGMSAAINAAQIRLTKLPIQPPDGVQLSTLPVETPSWLRLGADKVENQETVEVLGTTNYVSRVYVRKGTAEGERPVRLELHAAYYTGMIDTVPHVPERCMIGGGWQMGSGSRMAAIPLDQRQWRLNDGPRVPERLRGKVYDVRVPNWAPGAGTRVNLPVGIADTALRTTEFIIGRGERVQRVYAGYFFIANGETVSSAEGVRLLAFDLQNAYAYYLKVQFSSADVASAEELGREAGSLLGELLPALMRSVPDWVEVEAGRYPEGRADAKK